MCHDWLQRELQGVESEQGKSKSTHVRVAGKSLKVR